MYRYIILEFIGWLGLLGLTSLLLYQSRLAAQLYHFIKSNPLKVIITVIIFGCASGLIWYGRHPYPLHFAMPPTLHAVTADEVPPSLPLLNLIKFFSTNQNFEQVAHIGADPTTVPAPITRTAPTTVQYSLTAKEVIAEVYPGIYNNYWTYNNQVPGPMLRVREGDTVEITLTNDPTSLHAHNIDLHAATGPGGGASLTNVQPGETKSFSWKALAPGLYIYHCATSNVSVHNSHGQYGLILVEPIAGLAPVDHEFYIVQGELYTAGGIGKKGLLAFDPQALLDGIPTYVMFNGQVHTTPLLKAQVGDRIRLYVGNGGVNLTSNFHIIGEIFDTVYPEAALGPDSAILQNVQTTTIPAGGATIVEFTVDVPGKYVLVDHALARMNKGAWAILEVTGEDQPTIFQPLPLDNTTTNHDYTM